MANRVESRSYLQMALEKPQDIVKERDCFKAIFGRRFLPGDLVSILEVFGGAGILHGLLDEMGLTTEHTRYEAWDFSAECVEHLRKLYPSATIRQVDSFEEPIQPGWQVISADFNTWTFLKYAMKKPYEQLTARIFNAAPVFVQLTDASIGKMHLNHASYSLALGRKVWRFEEYVTAVSEAFHLAYGYSIVDVAHHYTAAYFLLTRSEPGPIHYTGV